MIETSSQPPEWGGDSQITERQWHIITCEYPPQIGGIADYTLQVANALAEIGHSCCVWAPGRAPEEHAPKKATVRRSFGNFAPQDIWRVNRLWTASSQPKRILLQWNPTGYGVKSCNLLLCVWLAWRVLRKDELLIVFHEAFMGIFEGPMHRRAAAVIQRLMTILLLGSASKALVSTSSLIPVLEPYCLRKNGKDQIATLPIPANVTPCASPIAVTNARRSIAPSGEPILGHFGLFSPHIERLLIPTLRELLKSNPEVKVSLIGAGSTKYLDELLSQAPSLSSRVFSTGPCSPEQASTQISACDAMLQPYLDGITTRRTSTMAALAHGKCVISTSGPLTEKIWRSTRAVHLIDSHDPTFIATETQRVLSSPIKAKQIADKGLDLYQEHFALRHTIQALTGDPSSTSEPLAQSRCASSPLAHKQ